MVAALKHPELLVDKVNWTIRREDKRLSIYKAHYSEMTKAHHSRVVASSKGLLQEESDQLMVHTSDVDPNAFKLIKKLKITLTKHHL